MRPGLHRSRGFTLIELMVVVALLGFFLTLTVRAYSTAFALFRRGSQHSLVNSQARLALQRMVREMEAALPAQAAGVLTGMDWQADFRGVPVPADRLSFTIPNGALGVVREGHGTGGQPLTPVTDLTYALAAQDGDPYPALTAIRQDRSPKGTSDVVVEVYARNVASMNFRYMDAQGEWRNEWPGPGFPRAIEVSLGLVDFALHDTVVTFSTAAQVKAQ
jgi:prepilin-type N-terminal cleavage/methylation domain-containing protein